MMDLNTSELAVATGTSADVIERLVDAGVLRPATAGVFVPSDIARVRLVLSMEASGVSVEALGGAIRSGDLSLRQVDILMPDPIPLLPRTHAEVREELGAPPELTQRIRALLGTAGASDEDPVRADDDELARMVAEAHAAGATPDDLTRIVLVFADSIRRVVAAQRDFSNQVLVQPYLEAGGSTAEALIDTLEARTRYRDLGRRLLLLLHTRFIEDISFQTVVELTEAALASKGISAAKPATMPAIAFVDQTGYTRMTGDLGDAAAAGAAARLAEMAQVTSASNDGRLVKLLGDGVMLYFRDAASAVKSTLELQAQSAEQDLAPLHAGIETGPVLARDGDFFGTVVNVSARIADYARPGEVLVTRAVVDARGGGGVVAFDEIGQTPLKNVARPVELFRARPVGR